MSSLNCDYSSTMLLCSSGAVRDIACKQKLKNVSESWCCFLDVNNLTRCDVTA